MLMIFKERWYRNSLILGACVALISYAFNTNNIVMHNPQTLGISASIAGALFAFMIGFITINVLNKFRYLRRAISREINAIQNTRALLVYLDDDPCVIADVEKSLKNYICSVISEEWPAMKNSTFVNSNRFVMLNTSSYLYEVMLSVKKITVQKDDDNDFIALSQIITHIGNIRDCRSERLELAQFHLPPSLRFFIYYMTFVLFSVICLIPYDNGAIGSAVNGVLGFSLAYIVAICFDIADPFSGLIALSADQFSHLLSDDSPTTEVNLAMAR